MTTATSSNLLTETETAKLLGIKATTLNAWRANRRYPLPWVRIGRCVRYRAEDVAMFIRDRTVSPCTELQPA
jgi:predicted DNA-binding transcriptional regulator AlpA